MTLVLLQYNKLNEQLRVLSDTRVCVNNRPTNDHVTKLFPLNVRIHNSSSTYEIDSTDISQLEFGFAFSGSVLGAFSTYTWCTALLNNMVPSSSLPNGWKPYLSVSTVAEVVRGIAHKVFYSACEKSSGTTQHTEAEYLVMHGFKLLLFGFDNELDKFVVSEISCGFDSEGQPVAWSSEAVMEQEQDGRTFCIGTSEFHQRYNDAIELGPQPSFEELFSHIINDTSVTSVGGHIMTGIATKSRFVVLPAAIAEDGTSIIAHELMGEDLKDVALEDIYIARQAVPITPQTDDA